METVSGSSRKQRPSRGAGGIGRQAGWLATFRRGDRVIYLYQAGGCRGAGNRDYLWRDALWPP
eukprot:2521731-Prymnesium_polylepis.1